MVTVAVKHWVAVVHPTRALPISLLEDDIWTIFGPETSHVHTPLSLKTFKLVGDNLDKNLKPSDVRVDSQTQSLYYFQTYGVRDRIDLTSYDDTPPVVDVLKVDTTQLLPPESDYEEILFPGSSSSEAVPSTRQVPDLLNCWTVQSEELSAEKFMDAFE